ncbi:adenosylcobinamide-phosphate synthase CbiB [Tropicimonas sp.]|uniref:adenosylcobinamide-phosphate synthase CbiB n=1 Tax=Tropicimonas sp. TaxID=2067044 RepID=UPI003A8781FB
MSENALLLLGALALDALLGEPRWLWSRLPHPAVLMGRLIAWTDRRFNSGAHRRLKGAMVLGGLSALAALLGWGIASLPGGEALSLLLAAILLAQRSLADHVAAVARALRLCVPGGRRAVAMIVGRDTDTMDEPAIARAAIESGAENLSDGVVAPAFWFLAGGLPGILVYKLVNTADSMIGYRTPRHEAFGWAAARLDDLLNLIPARLTAGLILLGSGGFGNWRAIRRAARRHRSPNAGWPEAAMAFCLDVALSGPRSYHGRMRDFPFINPGGNRTPGPAEIDACVSALWRSWAGLALLVAAIAAL